MTVNLLRAAFALVLAAVLTPLAAQAQSQYPSQRR